MSTYSNFIGSHTKYFAFLDVDFEMAVKYRLVLKFNTCMNSQREKIQHNRYYLCQVDSIGLARESSIYDLK